VQQLGQHRVVGDIGRRRRHRVDQLGAAVDPEMRLHPKIPLISLFGLMHLGIARALSAFLVDDGALMIAFFKNLPVARFRRERSCESSLTVDTDQSCAVPTRLPFAYEPGSPR
jgi:hypothetical protein